MANTDNPFGLRPIGNKGAGSGKVRPYYIPASYGTAMFIGDAVVKTGTSNTAAVDVPSTGRMEIGTMPEINRAAAGDGNRITGVIVGFAAKPNSLGTQYNPASTEGVAFVCDDPTAEFEIQADGAISAAQIGLNAVLIYTHAGSTTTGLSGAELDTTSDVPAADASNQLTIQRVVARSDNEAGSANTKVVVTINNHTEAHGVIGL